MGDVIFFETSALVAASIKDLNGSIEHNRYAESKGLLNLASDTKTKCITTLSIEEQANKVLEKALLDVMELEKRPDTVEEFRKYSTILDAVQRMYIENISFMDRLSTHKDTIAEIEDNEVYPMYDRLNANIREKPPKAYAVSNKFKGLARDINRDLMDEHRKKLDKLKEKSIMPDSKDRIILSEAIYLKRERFPRDTFYLSSLDNHFCGFKSPFTQIPEKIKEIFSITCLSPQRIIRLITDKKT